MNSFLDDFSTFRTGIISPNLKPLSAYTPLSVEESMRPNLMDFSTEYEVSVKFGQRVNIMAEDAYEEDRQLDYWRKIVKRNVIDYLYRDITNRIYEIAVELRLSSYENKVFADKLLQLMDEINKK